MRKIRLNMKPALLGGNIMVPMNEKNKTKCHKTCITIGGNTMVPMNEKNKTKYETCITRWEYNGSCK